MVKTQVKRLQGVHYKEIPKYDMLPKPTRDLIVQGISINSSYASQVQPAEKHGELPKQLGNKTECGLLGFLLDLGQSYQRVRDEFTEDRLVKVYTTADWLLYLC